MKTQEQRSRRQKRIECSPQEDDGPANRQKTARPREGERQNRDKWTDRLKRKSRKGACQKNSKAMNRHRLLANEGGDRCRIETKAITRHMLEVKV